MSGVPRNWAYTDLRQLGKWTGGGTPDKSNSDYWKSGSIPWVSPKDMKGQSVYETIDKITEHAVRESSTTLVDSGSIIFVTRSGILRRTLPVAVNRVSVALNQDLKALTPKTGIESDYIYHFIRGNEREILSTCRKTGTTVQSIVTNNLLSFHLPLPPLNEQRRIVAKIEELFSELDAGVENLKQARAQLGVYRQALLKQAFEGKLTERWRREHADDLEPAEVLLERIRKEREARYKQQLDDWKQAVADWEATGKEGKKPRKPRKPKPVEPLSEEELAELPDLPEGWLWIISADVGDIETGTTPSTSEPTFYGGKIPFFKPTDLVQGICVHDAREYLTSVGATHARLLPAGSTLVTCIGATIGKSGLAGVPCATNQQINSITPLNTFDSKFIYLQVVGPRFNESVKSNASSTTLPILNKSKFSTLPLAICLHSEQQQIVRLLEEHFSAIKENEREIDTAFQRAEALRQSILKKAFSGQLVPQDPNDEPASVLLQRIREERAAAEADKKKAKKKTARKKAKPEQQSLPL